MATTKTANKQAKEAGTNLPAHLSGVKRVAKDAHLYSTDELDGVGNILITAIELPSNANLMEVLVVSDDLSGDGNLRVDFGLAAVEKFTAKISQVPTVFKKDELVDEDFIRGGTSVLNSAVTTYSHRYRVDGFAQNVHKELWELLGYDENPQTTFALSVRIDVAATTPLAGYIAFIAEYSTNQ